jgi:hypothetical protein
MEHLANRKPGPVPIRQELRALKNNNFTQWMLYLLALQAFQQMPQSQLTSYYQVAGLYTLA